MLFSHQVMSDSLRPPGLQHASLLCLEKRRRFLNLPEFTQIHVHWINDVIQPSHPLSPSSPPALNLFQLQSLFQWVGSSHQVAEGLELQLQHQSFQWIFRVGFLKIDWFDLLLSKRLSKGFSSTTIWKHQFFSAQPSLWPNSHIHTWLLIKPWSEVTC